MPPWRHPMSVGGDFINKHTRTFCSAQRAASSMSLRKLDGATHNAKHHALPWKAPPSRAFLGTRGHARPQKPPCCVTKPATETATGGCGEEILELTATCLGRCPLRKIHTGVSNLDVARLADDDLFGDWGLRLVATLRPGYVLYEMTPPHSASYKSHSYVTQELVKMEYLVSAYDRFLVT